MACLGGSDSLLISLIVIMCSGSIITWSYNICGWPQPPPAGSDIINSFQCIRFNRGFANIWASDHQLVADDQSSVQIFLDKSSGTGFKTKVTYVHGFFSAAIKLPSNKYTAGVITTFYTSNAELYPDVHDEIDFEFLGRIPGEEYVLQTNVFGNGSTNIGREQRFELWFDPAADYHQYSILWTSKSILFFVDNIPIREFLNVPGLGGQFPLKRMYLYSTIWDASDWATDGGKFKANYTYAPFVASYANFILSGCATQGAQVPASCYSDDLLPFGKTIPITLSKQQRDSMEWVKANYLIYDYCQDKQRYPTPLPECRSMPPKSMESESMHEEF